MSYICAECGKELNLGAWDIAMVRGLEIYHSSCYDRIKQDIAKSNAQIIKEYERERKGA